MPTFALTALLSWAPLNVLTKRRYDALREKFGNLETAWQKLDEQLLRQLGCKPETVTRVLHLMKTAQVGQFTSSLKEQAIELLTIEDERYPELLREIPDAPVFLFARGDLVLLKQPSIALVGTRDMSRYGKRVAETLTQDLVRSGLVTVSGLARGIDAEVARQTISSGGRHIAVLGHGFAAAAMKRVSTLTEEIVGNGGLLLTEYPPDVPPDSYTFPARNRIIAGLSLGTVVLEASAGSGSLITASLALEYDREVFAVPGEIFDPHYAGTHELIAKGHGQLVRESGDILRSLGVVAPDPTSAHTYRPQTPDERVLLEVLSSMPQRTDDLIEKSGLPIATVNATLTLMELKGGVKNVGMGNWVRS